MESPSTTTTRSTAPAEPLSRSTSPASLRERTRLYRSNSSATTGDFTMRGVVSLFPDQDRVAQATIAQAQLFWRLAWVNHRIHREWFSPYQQVLLQREIQTAKDAFDFQIAQSSEAANGGVGNPEGLACLKCMERVVRLRLTHETYLMELILHRMTLSRREILNDDSVVVTMEPRLSIANHPVVEKPDGHSNTWWWCAKHHYTGGFDSNSEQRVKKRARWNKRRDFKQ